jgi:hypothetical protein
MPANNATNEVVMIVFPTREILVCLSFMEASSFRVDRRLTSTIAPFPVAFLNISDIRLVDAG